MTIVEHVLALIIAWLTPWEFSRVFLLCFALACGLYLRGCKQLRVSGSRRIAFWTGMAITYAALQTYFDFYAEHEFFMHRIQQLLLHHLAPLLIMASYPGHVLRAGLPLRWRRRWLGPIRRSWCWRGLAGIFANPVLATLLFVLFVLIWLVPPIQTLAMLDGRVYRFMNWSMVISGLIYWGLVLDHRPRPPGRMTPGMRVLSPGITMAPQILAGAIVTFSRTDLYPIFEICGRPFDFNVLTGQLVGGVIMWVPAATFETIGALLAMRQWLRLSRRGRIRRMRPSNGAVAAGAATIH